MDVCPQSRMRRRSARVKSRLAWMVCVAIAFVACSKKEAPAPATPAAPAPAASSSAPPAAPAASEASIAALGAGTVVVQKPEEASDAYGAFRLIDEASDRGWSTPDGVVTPQTMVFALPGRSELSRVDFDTEGLKPGRAAKDITVEVSDTSATAGFTKAADVSLQENANHQSFPLAAPVTGKWVRLTVQNNHGDKDNIELLEFRAFGKVLELAKVASLSGDYQTNVGDMQLRQDGASVTGCYGTDGGKLQGGLEGRTLKFSWRENSGDSGTAVVNFSDDAKEFFGLYWHAGETGGGTTWTGARATGTIAGCGLGEKSAEEQIASDLTSKGRVRLYGILFDTDSSTIKPESKATLDSVVATLKAHPDWAITIEGHTDSTGGDAHNQQLSQQRADSVKSYLVTAGVDGSKLTTKGLASSQPVAPNDTEIGRAQNRRVELAR